MKEYENKKLKTGNEKFNSSKEEKSSYMHKVKPKVKLESKNKSIMCFLKKK